jgi:carbon-monoxide dehydrogenase small subunit
MTLGFTLNGEEVVVQVEPTQRLVDIIREEFGLTGAKSACHSGFCGCCTVLLNGLPSPSCIVPAFRLRGVNVLTIQGFSKQIEYTDITQGFAEAGVENCGYCDSGKILIAESLLRRFASETATASASASAAASAAAATAVTKEEIAQAFDSIKCRCTDSESLIAGVIAARKIRIRRQLDK